MNFVETRWMDATLRRRAPGLPRSGRRATICAGASSLPPLISSLPPLVFAASVVLRRVSAVFISTRNGLENLLATLKLYLIACRWYVPHSRLQVAPASRVTSASRSNCREAGQETKFMLERDTCMNNAGLLAPRLAHLRRVDIVVPPCHLVNLSRRCAGRLHLRRGPGVRDISSRHSAVQPLHYLVHGPGRRDAPTMTFGALLEAQSYSYSAAHVSKTRPPNFLNRSIAQPSLKLDTPPG
ncbi:uncharacterized protein SCHCODRAFT_02229680 [Schizophyllum commune H4-8]|uniref:uncharacterized protein n=1 Tax=Schizophyllum commune (strain H4-8 / FGSC 9210) TaxID=578458 RepID=UPI00215E0ADB|nr:uncharacterized protein SCHCODRAFT_02229680 [Schizophyllum commune H4-8]KAI5895367.1 hypothetical protein SCHCODRAFT_02229680 [Schizophyllum commune H4-8]